jgi:DNA invertase Pin-like site-specific DNA recombinase
METPEKLVGLVRVSTDKQGESGLGLEAQENAIEQYRAKLGATLLKTYQEIESGTHDDTENRPQFKAAVAQAKRARAILVIAKLDRLVRSTIVLAELKKSRVRFVACDNPHANELTLDILAAVAANEARDISTRTKNALRAYKAGGHVSKRVKAMYPSGVPADIVKATAGKLGSNLPQCAGHLTTGARARGHLKSAATRRAAAVDAMADLVPALREKRAAGMSWGAIANWLNEEKQQARRGGAWSALQVRRVWVQAGG